MTALKKQLEETQRLRDQAEKARAEAEKAKTEAKRVRDEAEQHGYDVGVAEIENALRVEVPPYAEPTVLRPGKKHSTEQGLMLPLS